MFSVQFSKHKAKTCQGQHVYAGNKSISDTSEISRTPQTGRQSTPGKKYRIQIWTCPWSNIPRGSTDFLSRIRYQHILVPLRISLIHLTNENLNLWGRVTDLEATWLKKHQAVLTMLSLELIKYFSENLRIQVPNSVLSPSLKSFILVGLIGIFMVYLLGLSVQPLNISSNIYRQG